MADPTFVLVPGAGGVAWNLHRAVAELERRGRTAVAVDLPGDDPAAVLPEYVELIHTAARGLDEVVLVGHSLGGFTASRACPGLPVRELVLLNAMIPAPGETPDEWRVNTDHAAALRAEDLRAGRDPDDHDPMTRYWHDVPADVRAEALRRDRDESPATYATRWDLPAWPDVPTRVLVGTDERLFPVDFQRQVAADRLGLDVELLPGGHMVPLSRPRELVDALVR